MTEYLSWLLFDLTSNILTYTLQNIITLTEWGIGTYLIYRLFDRLIPLDFEETSKKHPFFLVSIIAVAGFCSAYLMKTVQFAKYLE